MAKDAVSLMDALKIGPRYKTSMGGMITQIIALDYQKGLSITPIMTTPGIQNDSLSDLLKNYLKQ